MKKRSEKKQEVEALQKDLQSAKNVFLTGYEKLTVQQDFELRKVVRRAGGTYRVVKNNLAEKAAQGTAAEALLSGIVGMSSVAYTSTDAVALAKALTDYAKTNASFSFKAGMVEGRVIDVQGIKDLATLPSREELFAKLLYVMNAPATNLARVINGVGRNLAVVVDQGCKENKFS
jgi:large subunit ribosomal protein L10